MMIFDMRTALVNYIAANLIGLLLMIFVVLRNRKDSKRLLGFIYFFALSAAGSLLILLRNGIPVFIGVVLANTLILTGKLFLYISLMKVYRLKPAIGYFIALIAVAFSGFICCTYINDNVSTRMFIIAAVSAAIHGTAALRIRSTLKTGQAGKEIMFIANIYYFICNLVRIAVMIITDETYGSIFDYNYDALMVLLNGVFILVLLSGVFHILEKEASEKAGKIDEKARFFSKVYLYSPVPIMIIDNLDRILFANEAACGMFGKNEKDLMDLKWIDLLKENEKSHAYHCIAMLSDKGKCSTREISVIGKDGREIPAEVIMESRVGEDGSSGRYTIFIHDLTYINEAKDRMIEAERSRQSLLESIPGFAYRCKDDENWTMEMLSGSFRHFTGYYRDEVIGNKSISFNEIIVPQHREPVRRMWEQCIEEKKPFIGEYKIIKKDKSEVWVWEHGKAIFDENGDVEALEGFIADISERKRYEEELKLFKTISDEAVHGNVITDRKGTIEYINRYFAMVHGYEPEELAGKHISVLVPEERVSSMNRSLKEIDEKGYMDSREIRHKRKDGSQIPMMMSGVAIKNNGGATERIALNAIDISEQRQLKEENILLEKHLRNQQRLETIGMLAGGVAHEINNPINGIMNYSQLILDTSGEGGEVRGYAGRIMDETKRVIMIIRNMLRFSRQQDTERNLVNVSDIVEQALSLARTVIKNDNIEIDVEIADDIPPIHCNDQQIQQILMNLITNARDALNEKIRDYDDNKKVSISCATLEKADGAYMRMTVEDAGGGIPPEVRDNVFKPFFTTKGSGEGTGLGLSISRNIAKEHKGELSFETETGEYTKFHLDLPL